MEGRDGALSALDALILVLNLAKDVCGIPPAQIALGSAAALLAMIRVRSLPLCDGQLLTLYPRILCPTNRITLNLDYRAGMYAKHLTGG